MNAEIGFSEYCLLLILLFAFVSPKDLGKAFAAFKHWKGKLYKMKFDLEDALMHEAKQEIPADESAWIVEAVRDFEPYRKASKVAAYHPLPNEPDIRPILSELAREGRLLLPRTFADGQMEFVEIRNLESDLAEGRFHVREPKKSLPAYAGEIPFALVPGTAFSADGTRHGHGKGYYDRFLARHPETVKCGVAFCAQMSRTPLPRKPHDIPMNYIVAPKTHLAKETPHVEKATVQPQPQAG